LNAPLTRALSLLIFGGPKSGKSTLAVTAPAPRLLLDVEYGARFLPIVPVKWDNLNNSPPEYDGTWDTAVVNVQNFDDVQKVYKWLKSGKHPFNSVIIDSISELQQRLIEKISNRMQMQTQDWGTVLRDFMGLMRDFRDLTEHRTNPMTAVVLLAMAVPDKDGRMRPFAQGQSRIMLPYLFDILGAMHVDTWEPEPGLPQSVHRLLIGPNRTYETGTRVDAKLIGGYVDNPTIPMLLDTIFGPLPDLTEAEVVA
jgi:AAA domain